MIIFRRVADFLTLALLLTFASNGHALGSRSIGGHAMAITKLNRLSSIYYTDIIASDGAGNVYQYDSNTYSLFKITQSGPFTFIAGNQTLNNGSCTDGTGANATFASPVAMTISGGNLYLADCQSLRKVVLSTGVVTTISGGHHFSPFGGIAIDAAGNFFTSEIQRGVSARKLYCDAYIVKTPPTGGSGSVFVGPSAVDLSQSLCANTDGSGNSARFINPAGLVIDQLGNLFLADATANNVRKITASGVVTTFAGCVGSACASGTIDGSGSNASFSGPTSMTFDGVGNIFVADAGSHIVRKINIFGAVRTVMGKANSTVSVMSAMPGQFSAPGALSFDSGKLYFVDNDSIYSVPKP